VEHFLFIVEPAEYLRLDVQLVIVQLDGLGQNRSGAEFLILIKSHTLYMRGLELLREKILHDKHTVGLPTRDAMPALPIHL
jgi:hypothetical protein